MIFFVCALRPCQSFDILKQSAIICYGLFSRHIKKLFHRKFVLCSVFEIIENEGVKTGNLNEDLATFSFGAINNRMQNTKTGFQLNFNF